MNETGRIQQPLPKTLRTILFGATADAAVAHELPLLARLDRAHALMLARAGLIDRGNARAFLHAIDEIEADHFSSFLAQSPVRGLYLLWEQQLRDRLAQPWEARFTWLGAVMI